MHLFLKAIAGLLRRSRLHARRMSPPAPRRVPMKRARQNLSRYSRVVA